MIRRLKALLVTLAIAAPAYGVSPLFTHSKIEGVFKEGVITKDAAPAGTMKDALQPTDAASATADQEQPDTLNLIDNANATPTSGIYKEIGQTDTNQTASTNREFVSLYHEVAYPHISTGVAQNFTVVTASATYFNLVPTGVIFPYAGSTVPTEFLKCDGTAVSRTTYARLFGVIGTTYGAGDGSTTFNVPNFNRRVPVGSGGSGTSTLGNAVGNTGGEETHTLSVAEMPAHTHTEIDSAGRPIGEGPGGTTAFYIPSSGAASVTGPTGSAGGGGAHNVMQPSLVVTYMIKT